MKYIFTFIIFFSCSSLASEIDPFTSDGCSIFPDGDMKDNSKWTMCCIRHDYAYWKGGTKIEREQADAELKTCVKDLGESNIASLMHLGVRLGGEPLYPMWYRWGYGWPYMRGYAPLTKQEKEKVKARMLELRDLIDDFIEKSQ